MSSIFPKCPHLQVLVWDPIYADARVCPQPTQSLLQLSPVIPPRGDLEQQSKDEAFVAGMIQEFPHLVTARDACVWPPAHIHTHI